MAASVLIAGWNSRIVRRRLTGCSDWLAHPPRSQHVCRAVGRADRMRRRIGAQASTPSAVTKGKQISVFTLRARCIIAPRTTTTLTTGSEGGRCGGGGRCIDTPRSQAALRPGCEKGVSDPAAAPKQKERSLFMVNESGILALGMKKNKRGRGAERGKGEARRRMSGGTGGLCSALSLP